MPLPRRGSDVTVNEITHLLDALCLIIIYEGGKVKSLAGFARNVTVNEITHLEERPDKRARRRREPGVELGLKIAGNDILKRGEVRAPRKRVPTTGHLRDENAETPPIDP